MTTTTNGPRWAGLTMMNQKRTDAAAERTVARAREVLASGAATPSAARVLRARVEHPHASLAQLAAGLGLTKDSYARRLARALDR